MKHLIQLQAASTKYAVLKNYLPVSKSSGGLKNIIKSFYLFIIITGFSCQDQKSIVSENISIKIYLYEVNNETKASAMPELKVESELIKYKRRFEYLLINISEIHLPDNFEERNRIFDLYPDTLEIKRLYLRKFVQDNRLLTYFEETFAPIDNPKVKVTKLYTVDELMEVGSKFFYCDKVNPDSSIQAHICVGLNGVKEAVWEKDYTLLEAFCYEGIFAQIEKEDSRIWDIFVSEKKKTYEQFKMTITTLEQYLEDVKFELFERMKNNETLKKELLEYYELNKTNLAFKILN